MTRLSYIWGAAFFAIAMIAAFVRLVYLATDVSNLPQ